jgi:rSAM/selenodomain-associated transferase 1
MARPRHLILFAKAPRFGAVKSRLALDVGRLAAWTFYRRTLAQIVRRLGHDRRWRTWLALTPDRAARAFRPRPKGARILGQGRGDLGQRLARAFARVTPAGTQKDTRAGPAVLVGADIPGITRAHIAEAFRRLGSFDAVFGPATDGGYWLVGFRSAPPAEVFRNVRWSSPHALADTLANLRGARANPRALKKTRPYRGARIAPPLATLQDVDDGAAFNRVRRRGAP